MLRTVVTCLLCVSCASAGELGPASSAGATVDAQSYAALAAVRNALRTSGATLQTVAEVRAALEKAGVDADRLKDSWGGSFVCRIRRHRVRGLTRTSVEFCSAGPDQRRGTADDACVDVAFRDPFTPLRQRIAAALASAPAFPTSIGQWETALAGGRIVSPKDPWGKPLRPVFQHYIIGSGESDMIAYDSIRLAGRHKSELAVFGRLSLNRPASEKMFGGTIEGTLTDGMRLGGPDPDTTMPRLPNAIVLLQSFDEGVVLETRSDRSGRYRFDDLALGLYRLQIGKRRYSSVERLIELESSRPKVEDFGVQLKKDVLTVNTASRAQ